MGPTMIVLTDAQTAAITNLARPLQPHERAAFLAQLLEDLLMRREAPGDGELGRLLRDLQRRYFQPPTIDERETPRWDSRSLGYDLQHLRRQLIRRSASAEPALVSRRDREARGGGQ
jgi:hypothetical protein